jgi:hypothetical protein
MRPSKTNEERLMLPESERIEMRVIRKCSWNAGSQIQMRGEFNYWSKAIRRGLRVSTGEHSLPLIAKPRRHELAWHLPAMH